jgi:uncharacterized repeat protein (TIGR03803 family)
MTFKTSEAVSNFFDYFFGVTMLLAALFLLLLALCWPAHAQTLTTLYNFNGKAAGGRPNTAVVLQNGGIYGTTSTGGGDQTKGQGVVYQVSAGKETAIVKFNSKDGKLPEGGLAQDGSGNFYGTTLMGGAYDRGTIYKLSGVTVTVLHSFTGQADGRWPTQGVLVNGGEIYGTSDSALFRLDQSGFMILHTFDGGKDGSQPTSPLILDQDGNLYGTTGGGGAYGYGALYEFDQAGTFTILHSFGQGGDGYNAVGPLSFDTAGNLYGTTEYGGGSANCGTVYEFSQGQETIIHAFQGPDGCAPSSGVIFDAAGNLYGATQIGGASSLGAIFEISQGQETLLHSFSGLDGSYPQGLALDDEGNLYGAANGGGTKNYGTVFELVK